MNKIVLKIKSNLYIFFTLLCGFILRIYFGFLASKDVSQHDVIGKQGHMAYAQYIFKNGCLPLSNDHQFYHPPFNAFMQSIVMRVARFITGSKSANYLYSFSNILSVAYTIAALIFMYLILKRFCKNKFIKNFTLFIVSFYPGLIFMATQYNNDPPAFMFFFMALYFAIKWAETYKLRDIIITAIAIGLGMLTKISVGLIAFIIGPMMLISLYKNKKALWQIFVFALIVFPLGLSYAARNYLLFGQKLNYVLRITTDFMQTDGHSFVERFLSFPLSRLFAGEFGIYHDIREYNVWVDLVKTSTYDETIYLETIYHIPCFILLCINFIFSIISVIATIYAVYTFINSIRKKEEVDVLFIISLILIIISVISYVSFNIAHPVSCTSSYRYVAYATFAFSYLVGFMIYDLFLKKKGNL